MPIAETAHTDPVTAIRVADAVAPVQAIPPSGSQTSAENRRDTAPDPQPDSDRHAQSAGAAEYARVNARIADIFAALNATAEPVSHKEAEHRILALMPDPVIIIPLPPASADMVERAAQLAQDMAQQAAQARSAQSNLLRGTVDAVLAPAT